MATGPSTTFRVRAEVTISLSQLVRADTAPVALIAAERLNLPTLSQFNPGWSQDWQLSSTGGALDGTLKSLNVESEDGTVLLTLLTPLTEALREVDAALTCLPSAENVRELLDGECTEVEFCQALGGVAEALTALRSLLEKAVRS